MDATHPAATPSRNITHTHTAEAHALYDHATHQSRPAVHACRVRRWLHWVLWTHPFTQTTSCLSLHNNCTSSLTTSLHLMSCVTSATTACHKVYLVSSTHLTCVITGTSTRTSSLITLMVFVMTTSVNPCVLISLSNSPSMMRPGPCSNSSSTLSGCMLSCVLMRLSTMLMATGNA